ncbi:hypothetical protein ACS49_01455 [Bacillus cereus]|nr:hypothetical protein ACS49_01455 [Bacillus cereus]
MFCFEKKNHDWQMVKRDQSRFQNCMKEESEKPTHSKAQIKRNHRRQQVNQKCEYDYTEKQLVKLIVMRVNSVP